MRACLMAGRECFWENRPIPNPLFDTNMIWHIEEPIRRTTVSQTIQLHMEVCKYDV